MNLPFIHGLGSKNPSVASDLRSAPDRRSYPFTLPHQTQPLLNSARDSDRDSKGIAYLYGGGGGSGGGEVRSSSSSSVCAYFHSMDAGRRVGGV